MFPKAICKVADTAAAMLSGGVETSFHDEVTTT